MNKTAVIYARFSSDHQREESIEGQLRECGEFAARKGYTVIKSYCDRAISGKRAENRPQFMQMIEDSAKGEFDYVIVWKLDRFSRDKYDSVSYKVRLKKNNVSVISATEPIDDSPEGQLMESIFEGFAQYYVKDLEIKISRGMTENALKGKFNGGGKTFGYAIKDSRLVINEDEAAIVAEIFTRYADGENIKAIADDLTVRGVMYSGKKLSYHFMNRLLKNRRYIGEYTFRDILNTEAIPAIIDLELFERAQKRIEANRRKPANYRAVDEKYLLTGKIFCGECGDTMAGVSGTGKHKVIYRYYSCMSSRRKRCKKKPVTKSVVENAVIKVTMQIFEDKALVKRIAETCYKMQNTVGSQLAALKKQLRHKKDEMDNLMNAIKAGLFTKSTKAELERLEQEQENLEILVAQEQIIRPTITKEQIEEWILHFAEANLESNEQKQRLIDIFVNSIYVYDDKIVVFLNYKDGEKCITFDELAEEKKKTNTRSKCSSFVAFGGDKGF